MRPRDDASQGGVHYYNLEQCAKRTEFFRLCHQYRNEVLFSQGLVRRQPEMIMNYRNACKYKNVNENVNDRDVFVTLRIFARGLLRS
jgi:hypothetical protein